MALALGCAEQDIPWIRERLRTELGTLVEPARLDPLSQLVKSFISSRTYDEISEQAYLRLTTRYANWQAVAAAEWRDIEAVIADVTHVRPKAQRLGPALAMIGAKRSDFALDFLEDWPVERALAWLERLPGVGRKIAASTLNFSRLCRPAFVVDLHVLRIMVRFGLVDRHAPIIRAYDRMMEATDGWRAFDLLELHALMKHLGQTQCRPVPRCEGCPLQPRCRGIGVRAQATKKAALPPPSSPVHL